MPLPKERIMYLLEAFTSKTATQKEEEELMQWVEGARENSELKEYMQKLWNGYQPGTDFNQVEWETMYQNIMSKEKVYSIAPKRRFFLWTKVAAAVAFLMVLSIGGYFLLRQGKQAAPIAAVIHDVKPPKFNKATIKLSGGKVIILDSAGNGLLARQGNIQVTKLDNGQIAYAENGTSTEGEATFNTLTNPRGSKVINLTLTDGTKVWLNDESSLTYPTVFTGKERKVQVTGEAYFEVAHNAKMPFKVTKGDVTVTVLGTHFDVKAYEDESNLKVTLLEGLVKVSKGSASKIIKPGEQAIAFMDGKLSINTSVDLEEVMAWKNGYFSFNSKPIKSIMNEISRWYDAEVVYEGPMPEDLFSGIINRDNNVSQVLKMLEETNRVHFRIENHKVIVTH